MRCPRRPTFNPALCQLNGELVSPPPMHLGMAVAAWKINKNVLVIQTSTQANGEVIKRDKTR
jgi:hypothetical protein